MPLKPEINLSHNQHVSRSNTLDHSFARGLHPATKKIARSILFALVTVSVAGCSSVVESRYYKNVQLDSLKKAYVTHDPGSTLGCANAAEEALKARGLSVTSGDLNNKPKDADFYVEVVDRWRWDLAMYLLSLDILFKDNATGELIATGTFRQGGFHSFPDQRHTTFEVIDAIYSRQPAQK